MGNYSREGSLIFAVLSLNPVMWAHFHLCKQPFLSAWFKPVQRNNRMGTRIYCWKILEAFKKPNTVFSCCFLSWFTTKLVPLYIMEK